MSRRNRDVSNYYCPKCNHKKMRHRMWRESRIHFWECFNTACKLRIEVEGRDAEIADYRNPVDRVARYELRIPDYFAQHDQNVYKKGFELLYEGGICFLVRHRTKNEGVCVALYWKATTIDKDDEDVVNPFRERYLFDHAAAAAIEFQGKTLLGIINTSSYWPTIVWKKNRAFRFQGTLNAALKTQMVEWATELDAALPELIEQARAKVNEWKEAYQAITDYVADSGVQIGAFNHHKKKSIALTLRRLSIEECYRLDKILPKKLEIDLVKGVDSLTTEQAESVVELLGVEDLAFKASIDYRVTPKMAKKLADALSDVKAEV